MKKAQLWIVAGATAVMASTGIAQAAGYDLSDQNFDLLFRQGNFVEVGGSYNMPMRKVKGAIATSPMTGLPVAGGLGGDFTSDFGRLIGRVKFEPASWADCQIAYQAPFGGGIDYDPNWVGRYHIISADIAAHDASLACKVDIPTGSAWTLSIIGGARGEWLSSEATRAIAMPVLPFPFPALPDGLATTKADSFGMGYDIGAAITRPEFGFRFSAIYHSRIDHELKGTQTVTTPLTGTVSFPVRWDFVTPAALDLEVQSGLSRTLLGHLRLRFVDWSPLNTVTVVNSATGAVVGTDRLGFMDTWSVAAGITKLVNEKLAIDFTAGYDPDVAGMATRGPTNTTTAFIFGALSAAYKIDDTFTLNGSLRAVRFLPTDMSIVDPNLGFVPATYRASTGSDMALSGAFWITASF